MELSVIGSGYVGTTIAACFADLGHTVTNIDTDDEIAATTNGGDAPIHEDGLAALIDAHAGPNSTGRLITTTEYKTVLDTDVTFLCPPTPQKEDGSIDLSIIEAVAEQLGETLAKTDSWHTVVVKSTVIPGSTEEVITPILEDKTATKAGEAFGVGMNPEFLREGTAVDDLLNSDKLVLGADDPKALEDMQAVFDSLISRVDPPVVETNTRTVEMIKYASNTFFDVKISLINGIGNICKEFGVDAYEVAEAIAFDARIGEQFLRSGVGWGGSRFEKDTAAIRAVARDHGYTPAMLDAAATVNDGQPGRLFSLMDTHIDVTGKRVGVLGLSFKPGTDDIRNSRAIPVIEGLQERGVEIVAYDPIAIENMRERFPDIEYAETAAAALVVTDWGEITELDEEFDSMATPVVIDGRRAINRRDGIVYEGLTW